MQTLTTKSSLAFGSNSLQQASRPMPRANAQVHDGADGMPGGWWLIPSIIGGAAFWIWTITALFS